MPCFWRPRGATRNSALNSKQLTQHPGDRARVEQVLINMVSNAIKYTHNGGRISITAGATDDCVWALVKDNGVGIPSADVPRVLTGFTEWTRPGQGNPVALAAGLSIAKEIVARHNGTVELDSQLGKGTTITVTLPVKGAGHDQKE